MTAAAVAQVKSASSKPVQLKRQLGLIQGIAIICGLVIGSGIYVSPTGVLRQVPSSGVALIIWVVAGLTQTLGALTFAEIGTTFPRAGEKYTYLNEMIGPFPAFLYLWQYFLFARPTGNAVKSIMFATYILKPLFWNCLIPHSAVILVAICLAAFISFINSINIRLAARLQTVFTSTTILSLIAIILMSWLYFVKSPHHLGISEVWEGADELTAGKVVLGFYSCLFSYRGWNALNFMVEELKDAKKNLPRAIMVSMAIICVLYVLVNCAYLGVLGVDNVIKSEAVVATFGIVTIGKATWILTILIAINNMGSLNGGVLIGSRLVFAASRNNHLPGMFALIQTKYRSPPAAVILQFIIMVLLCIFVDLYVLVTQLIFVNLLIDLLCVIGMVKLRYTTPDMKRPIKMPLWVPITYGISVLFLSVVAIITRPRDTATGLILVLCTAVPYYVLFVKNVIKSKTLDKYTHHFTAFVQKLLMSIPQEGSVEEE